MERRPGLLRNDAFQGARSTTSKYLRIVRLGKLFASLSARILRLVETDWDRRVKNAIEMRVVFQKLDTIDSLISQPFAPKRAVADQFITFISS